MANNCQTTVTESSTFLAQYGEQYYMTIAAIGHSFMSFLIKAQCILVRYEFRRQKDIDTPDFP